MAKITKAQLEAENVALYSRVEELIVWGRGFASKYNWLVADANKRIFALEKRLQKAATCWREQHAEIVGLKADLATAQMKIAELEAQLNNSSTTAA